MFKWVWDLGKLNFFLDKEKMLAFSCQLGKKKSSFCLRLTGRDFVDSFELKRLIKQKPDEKYIFSSTHSSSRLVSTPFNPELRPIERIYTISQAFFRSFANQVALTWLRSIALKYFFSLWSSLNMLKHFNTGSNAWLSLGSHSNNSGKRERFSWICLDLRLDQFSLSRFHS